MPTPSSRRPRRGDPTAPWAGATSPAAFIQRAIRAGVDQRVVALLIGDAMAFVLETAKENGARPDARVQAAVRLAVQGHWDQAEEHFHQMLAMPEGQKPKPLWALGEFLWATQLAMRIATRGHFPSNSSECETLNGLGSRLLLAMGMSPNTTKRIAAGKRAIVGRMNTSLNQVVARMPQAIQPKAEDPIRAFRHVL